MGPVGISAAVVIIGNVIEGVTIAVVAAGLLSFYQWLTTQLARREQMRYLRNVIAVGYRQISDAETIQHDEFRGAQPVWELSKESIRFMVFERLVEDASTAVDYRTDNMTYKQKYELRKILMDASLFVNKIKTVGGHPQELRFYEQQFFAKVRKIDWLVEAAPDPLK